MRVASIEIALLTLCFFKYSDGGYHQKNLLAKLFRNYNKIERPVTIENQSLNVTIGLGK